MKVDIHKKLKEFDLNVKFQIDQGCLGILGASGCGKSMTLKSIAGIVSADSGYISIDDKVLFDSQNKVNLKPQKRKVGYLFQNYALFPNMSVEQNIACGLEKKDDERINEMIQRFHLQGLEKRYPRQLSGGQQQRVALARILAYEPSVILLDEPFSAMDTFLKEELRLELIKVLKEYKGVSLLVTHDRDEAYQLCDNLMLLDQGKVIAFGKTKEVFENPGTIKAARLTGCKNISRIERISDDKVKALDWNDLELEVSQEIDDSIQYIGIRAHDMHITDSKVNRIPVGIPQVSEMPFEWYVTLENGLWWKIEKDMHIHDYHDMLPEFLTIAPQSILLLKDDI
ncbi:MAG: sulfate/molybdate ABC transporter ATP-binding protein [Erysipelotrichaceae bacterium]|nr:sulfate/molybdate ABC transporter ATP-binding protein [Erysipelotrichaceae bacterium]